MAAPAHAHSHHEHPGFDVKVERSGPCTAKVQFTVPATEYKKARELGLHDVAQRTRVKGFRPGKTPLNLVEKQFGAEVEKEVLQHFLNHAYEKAIQEHGLRPAAHPRVNLEELKPAPGADLMHSFEILLRPEIKLGTYKGLKVARQKIDVSDAEIDQTQAEIRRQNARVEPAGDAGLEAEGLALAKLVFQLEGETAPVLERDGIRVSPKSAMNGVEASAWEQALVGAKSGETREVALTFPSDFPEERARLREGRVVITTSEVVRVLLPSPEEIQKAFGVTGAEALRDVLRGRIRSAKEEQEDQRIETLLLDLLLEGHPMDLPEALVADQVKSKAAEFEKALAGQGVAEADLAERVAAESKSFEDMTRKAMRAVYLMEAIAKSEDIKVNDQDVKAEIQAIATRNSASVDEVRKYYQDERMLPQLALELLERKVRGFLRGSADIQAPG